MSSPSTTEIRTDRSRIRSSDLVTEALNGILQRPTRSALTALGTILGIGSFVAILGLTQTASAQISKRFDRFAATTVTVTDLTPERDGTPGNGFPADSRHVVGNLAGVDAAALTWKVPIGDAGIRSRPDPTAPTIPLDVRATSPGLAEAAGAHMTAGVPINSFHSERREHVAVLGTAAARQLGISRLDEAPAIFIGADAYTVIGILDDPERLPQLSTSVLVPDTVATDRYGPPQAADPATMTIATNPGAAQVVASQVAVALRPDDPTTFKVAAPPDPRTLRDDINSDINSLFLALAAVAIIIGAVGIANTTLVAILERTPEIGLRRSLGARPRHITVQFLAESALLGTLGGLIGATLGVLAIIAISVAQGWSTLINPAFVIPGPIAGAVIGLAAGLYPSIRASRIEPAQAMRQ